MTINPVQFNLGDPDDYNPVTLSRLPESELRKEYTRLRRVAQKRLDRIERSSDFSDSPIVTNNKPWLATPPSSIPAADLPSALSHVASLLSAKTGTLTGLRKARAKTLESLRSSGVRGITPKNYGSFTSFMRKTQVYREAYIPYPKRSKGTERRDAARQLRPRMFSLTQNGNVSESAIMKEFQFFRDNLDKIEKLARSGAINKERKRPYSANEIRKLLGQEPEKAPTIKEARSEAAAKAPKKEKKKRARGQGRGRRS